MTSAEWVCSGCGKHFSSMGVYCPDCKELVKQVEQHLCFTGFFVLLEDGLSNVECPNCSFPLPLDIRIRECEVCFHCRGCQTVWHWKELLELLCQ